MCWNISKSDPDMSGSIGVLSGSALEPLGCPTGSNYTYYMPLDESLSGQEITLYAMICKDGQDRFSTDVYLCSPNDDKHGATLILQ